jgi:hypothetical protein
MNEPTPTTALAPDGAEDIRDIRGLVEIGSPWTLVLWCLAALVLLAALALLVRRLRRPAAAPPPPPADAVALARLERARALMVPDRVRAFGGEVSDAVREYIEARFAAHAPRRTTDEFLREVVRSPAPGLERHLPTLESFLRETDLAKFARHPLTVPEMESLLGTAFRFVEQTRPTAGEEKRA